MAVFSAESLEHTLVETITDLRMRLTYKRFCVLAETEVKADTLGFEQYTVPI